MWYKRHLRRRPWKVNTAPNYDPELHRLLNLRPETEGDQYDDTAVSSLLKRNPGAAAVTYDLRRDGRGTCRRYPLQRIIRLGASLDTIRLCYWCHPAARMERTENNGTVLHAACGNASDLDVVQYIVRKYVDSVKVTTKHGFTPLHNACSYGSPAEVVQLLVTLYPEALEMKNKLGETPHMAALNHGGADADVLAALSSAGLERYGGSRRNGKTISPSWWRKVCPRRTTVTTIVSS